MSRRIRTRVRLSEIKRAAEEQCAEPSFEGDQRWRRDDVRSQVVAETSCRDCEGACLRSTDWLTRAGDGGRQPAKRHDDQCVKQTESSTAATGVKSADCQRRRDDDDGATPVVSSCLTTQRSLSVPAITTDSGSHQSHRPTAVDRSTHSCPFCVTRSNPTRQLTDPTQPNPVKVEKFGSNPTQPNTSNNNIQALSVTDNFSEFYLQDGGENQLA